MTLHIRLEDPEARTVPVLLERVQPQGAAPSGHLLADPIAAWAAAGAGDVDAGVQRLVEALADAQDARLRLLGVDATVVGEAGGSAVHQIGYALAGVSEYLAAGRDAGLDAAVVADHLHVRLAVGTSYPLEVAALRALRLLLPDVLSPYDAPEAVPPLVASVAERPLTAYAPYTNMLRGTTAATAAIVGGCDALIVQPYDRLDPESDALGRRIARNTQLILKLESHLGFVEDPAAGSYYLETLTHQLAEAAWALLQDIEAAGGLRSALRGGLIQDTVAAHASQQAQAVDERERVLVGATHYPDMEETRTAPPEAPVQRKAHPLPDAVPPPSSAADPIRPLVRARLAADVEQLRYRTDQYAEAHGQRPQAALLPIGPRGMRAARATFARNYLGCAGFAIHESTGYADVAAGLDAAEKTGADLLVLCSSDEAYRTLVPDLAAARDARGLAQPIVVAGYPEDDSSALRAAGAAAFIHRQAPLLDTLSHLQSLLGIS
jgi:methylmalonyl-CoA mutase